MLSYSANILSEEKKCFSWKSTTKVARPINCYNLQTTRIMVTTLVH